MNTLGDLINTLAALDRDLPVVMDGESGLGFCSWRGDYAEVSLHHGFTQYGDGAAREFFHGVSWMQASGGGCIPPATTVGELLDAARSVDGAYLTGYKGGAYEMDVHTRLWADEWGEFQGRYVSGFELADGVVRINTEGEL